MSKAVLISIRPEWCRAIIEGRKTVEVRKTKPKNKTPFKCYIYCTQQGSSAPKGYVIGEFTCDCIDKLVPASDPYGIYDIDDDYVFATCLQGGALWDYGHGATLYGWHISELRIYDTPRDLHDFTGLRDTRFGAALYDIKRAPQSWCYVEGAKARHQTTTSLECGTGG